MSNKKTSKFPPKKPDNSHIIKASPKRNWSEFQKDIFRDIARATDHTVVIARAGSGKCLGINTEVLMFDGTIKKVQDILAGEELMGPDSKPRKVLNTNIGYGKLFNIVPTKGQSWVCNEDHILTLIKSNHGKGKIIDISLSDFIKQNEHLKDLSKNWKLIKSGVEFGNYSVPFDPYFLGLWIGDGSYSKTQITNVEPEIINYCEQFAKDNNIICRKTFMPRDNCFRIDFSIGKRGDAHRGTPFELRRFLLKQCSLNGKKNIPINYLVNSRDNRLKLLAGIIDTDGYNNKNCFEVVTIEDNLSDQYLFLARSLGFAAYKKLKHTSIKSINYHGLAWRIYISGNTEQIPCKVNKKICQKRKQIKNHLCTGFSINQIDDGNYYGFTLDGDGRFLLGDFTITHNTSTIVEGFKYLPKGKKALMVAFNKSIADELKQRAPSYVDTMTLHSLGFRAIKQSFGAGVILENDKCKTIVSSLIGDDYDLWELNQSICKCVSLCKGFLFDTPKGVNDLIDQFGIEIFDLTREKFTEHVLKALALCKANKMVIDFDDMIWFPFVYRLNVGKFDVVFVDEAQDLNAAQIAMVMSAVKPGGRIIAVGDPQQAIYLFRGADSESIPNFINKLKAKTLPLSVTYRCPKHVVALAQEVVPDIQAHESSPDGEVINLDSHDLLKTVSPGDFILSRTNAPLIKYCMALLKSGIPANIQGRDVGANLLYFIKKSKAKTINSFIDYVNTWKEQEVERLLSEKKNTSNAIDKAECLLNLCEGTLTIKDLKETIEKLFNDIADDKKVILSTTHKAKGLERDKVFVLVNTYRYGPGVEGEEANLWYVAITRAKQKLYLVRKPGKYAQYDDKKLEDIE